MSIFLNTKPRVPVSRDLHVEFLERCKEGTEGRRPRELARRGKNHGDYKTIIAKPISEKKNNDVVDYGHKKIRPAHTQRELFTGDWAAKN